MSAGVIASVELELWCFCSVYFSLLHFDIFLFLLGSVGLSVSQLIYHFSPSESFDDQWIPPLQRSCGSLHFKSSGFGAQHSAYFSFCFFQCNVLVLQNYISPSTILPFHRFLWWNICKNNIIIILFCTVMSLIMVVPPIYDPPQLYCSLYTLRAHSNNNMNNNDNNNMRWAVTTDRHSLTLTSSDLSKQLIES